MDIELRLLRSFVAIHEAGSISRAADRMACTQAAMSMRLKMIETEIGAPLFLRRPQGLLPTPRGAELYAKALGVLSAYDEMMSLTRTGADHQKVRIGMPDDYALGWLGQVLHQLCPDLARIELEVVCDLSANLMAAVQRAEVDMALVTLAARPAQARAAIEVPLHWVRRAGSAATNADLAAYAEGCVFRRAMIRALDAAQVPWRVSVQSNSHAGIFAAVRAGVCVTSVAAGTAPDDLVEFASAPGFPPLGAIPVYLVTTTPLSPAASQVEIALRGALAQGGVAA